MPDTITSPAASRWAIKVTSDGRHFHLELTPPPEAPGPTDPQVQLATRLTRVVRCLNSVYVEESRIATWMFGFLKPHCLVDPQQYLTLLEGIARVGLVADEKQVAYARAALATLEEEIFILAGYAKRRWYLIKCAVYSGLMAALSLILFSRHVCSVFDHLRPDACSSFGGIFLILSGSMLGIWLSIASSRVATTIDDLEQVINDPLGPGLRILFVLNIAFAGGVLLYSGLVDVTIGTLKLKELGQAGGSKTGEMLLVLIGILFGFSEKTLPSMLSSRAQTLIASLGAKGG